MITVTLVVPNPLGLHIRAASQVAALASRFQSSIELSCHNKVVDAKRIMAVMALGAGQGDAVTLSVSGGDEVEACKAVQELIEQGFGELTSTDTP